MINKKSLSIVTVLFIALIFNGVISASHNFRQFNINDYPQDQLSKKELAEQVRDFSINVLKELEYCKSRGEQEKQDYYCTNIYEADRIRLSLLLAINANLPEDIATEDNGVSRLIFKRDSFLGGTDGVTIEANQSDTDGQNPQANEIKKTLVTNDDIKTVTSNSNYHFFIKATALGLRSCATGSGSSTKDRFITLNYHLRKDGDKKASEYPPIGCNDLIEVVKQFANEQSLKTIIEATDDFAWLNFNNSEKANIVSSQEERDYYNNLKNNGHSYINAKSECVLRGLSALLLCPSARFLSGASQAGLDGIKNKLLLNPQLINTSSASGQVLYRVWQEFQTLSNLLFIISLLTVIIAYLINLKVDTYHLKKILPRLAGLAILSNLSFLILRFGIDISNLTGQGLYMTFLRLSGTPINIMNITSGILSGSLSIALTGVVVAAGFYFGGIVALIPILIFTASSILAVIFSLAFRDGAFILAVVTAPLAIASLLLPNFNRLFQVWKTTITTIFMIPIVVGFCFGAGMLASSLLFRSGGFMSILSFIPLALQVVIFPKLLLNSVRNLPIIGHKLSEYLTKGSTFAGKKYQDSDFHKTALHNYKVKRAKQREKAIFNKTDPRTYLNPIRKSIRNASRRGIDKILPGYSTVVSAPSFDPEVFKQITDTAGQLSPMVAKHFLVQKGILSDKNGNLAKEFNGLDSNVKNQVKALVNSNDPNNILSALLNASDDGTGNADMVFQGLNAYANLGGERDYITKTLKDIEANFKKENMFSDAAQINNALGSITPINQTGGDYTSLGVDETRLINMTALYMEDVNNWAKFKGFANKGPGSANYVNDQAFRQFINTPGIDKASVINAIKKQAGQQQSAMDYLSKV